MTNQTDDDQPPEDDYDVGYGRPPKHSQFQPGKSGNPKGRIRKPKSTQDQMRTILSKRITISEGGQSRRVSLQEVMLRSIANKAAKGDLRAAQFVLNLINSAEAARTETIAEAMLSTEDQVLFAQMMKEMGNNGDTSETEPDASNHPITHAKELPANDT